MAFPPAQGSRLPWEALPDGVRAAVEDGLGASVVESVTQPGGFSPGVAARLRLEDGRRAFVKAVGSSPNPDSPDLHRREARVAAALPHEAPVPRLLFAHDDGNWVALVFEDVDGRQPSLPWREDELERVLGAMTELAAALTPPPLPGPSIAEHLEDAFHGWRILMKGGDAPGLDPWARSRLDLLAELEAAWLEASSGSTLLHADVRADNVLLTPKQVVFVDWPHACVGAAWIDLVALLPSVAMQRGPKPWELFDAHPLAQEASPESVDAFVAALAGYFVHGGTLLPPPGLPTVREFQRAQGVEALAWLRRRLDES